MWRGRSPIRAGRGQTSLDFVIGIGIFLLTLALVVSFVPEMFVSVDGEQEQSLVADRVADRLLDGALAGPSGPSTLDTGCTLTFFGAGNGSGCGFDPANPLTERVGVDDSYGVNVSLQRDVSAGSGPETLCTDGSGVHACPGNTILAAGPTVPVDHSSVSTARRTGYVDGKDVTLVVRVW